MFDTLLKSCGGQKTTLMGAGSDDPLNPDNAVWNFGVKPQTEKVRQVVAAAPSMADRFPKLVGKWDGKSTINHWDAAKKVLGEDKAEELIQHQPRGTCGGRAGSFAGDLIQLILIASGVRAKFHRVSHAAIYYAARSMFDMLGGDWRDDNQDGVASGSVPKALAAVGAVQRDEDSDITWYGEGSDDLACKLGAGLLPDVAKKIKLDGSDNLVTQWVKINSAQELADGIAAGGVGIGSDSQGFTMSRDGDGFCSPRGTWHHYQIRLSVGLLGARQRKGFGYNQSWGKGNPTGPRLEGHPGNCFGVDFDVQDRIIKSGSWAVVFGFPVWDLEEDKINVNWMF